jgi:Xaa-Pro dipeptidase
MQQLNASLEQLFPGHIEGLAQRWAGALKATGHRAALVAAGTPRELFLDDQSAPFRVNPLFKAWVPLVDAPGSLVYVEPGRRPRLVLHSPRDYWHKAAAVPQGWWVAHFDVEAAGSAGALRAALPADLSGVAWLGEPAREITSWGVGAVNPEHLLERLAFDRAVKSPYELECLRVASRLGARGHVAAEQAWRGGGSEFDVALAFMRGCGLREQELPYNPIVAMNEGAAVLHYQVLARRAPSTRRSLLIDAGAEFVGYASDITRTFAWQDGEFGALVERMDVMQQELCAVVKAGVDWRNVHVAAHLALGAVLQDAGIIRCDAQRAVLAGVTRAFLPHGIGHLLGLQVHDVGGLQASPEGGEIPRPPGHPYLRLTRTLQEGFVVTMEPGLYFIDMLLDEARADARAALIDWDRVERLKPFGGIRIEDDLAVTRDGCENLTRAAFAAEAAGLA